MQLTGNAPTGTPTWIDFLCKDVAATGDFFHQLLGWDVPEGNPEFGGYTTATLDGANMSGFGPADPNMPTDVQQVYLAADDIQLVIDKCKAAGGKVMDFGMGEVMPVGDFGTMAVITDPAGATFGLWQGNTHTGFGAFDEVGAPCRFEVVSRDAAKTKTFLNEVFGYEFSGDSSYEMATLPGAGTSAFGVMQTPPEMPEHVPSYFIGYYTVEDLGASVAKIEELGGKVIMAGEIESGHWLNAMTPGGATFGLYAYDK